MRDHDLRDRWYEREYPAGTGYSDGNTDRVSIVDNRPLYGKHHIPDNQYEALMVCAPHQDPVEHDMAAPSAMIEHAMSTLTRQERCVVECVVFAHMSRSEAGLWLAREMGRGKSYSKTTVSTLLRSALSKMRIVLGENCE